jgi:hypothetical protein
LPGSWPQSPGNLFDVLSPSKRCFMIDSVA